MECIYGKEVTDKCPVCESWNIDITKHVVERPKEINALWVNAWAGICNACPVRMLYVRDHPKKAYGLGEK